MNNNAFKKVQYGYHGKNGVFSDHTERTYSETYSKNLSRKIRTNRNRTWVILTVRGFPTIISVTFDFGLSDFYLFNTPVQCEIATSL